MRKPKIVWLARGIGIDKNEQEAVRLLRLAVDQNNSEVQNILIIKPPFLLFCPR